jgi:hypothetical protein
MGKYGKYQKRWGILIEQLILVELQQHVTGFKIVLKLQEWSLFLK